MNINGKLFEAGKSTHRLASTQEKPWKVICFKEILELRTHHDMTTKELFQACLEAWKVKADGKYKLILIRAEGQSEISLEGTVKEAGIRNGDFLEIVAA